MNQVTQITLSGKLDCLDTLREMVIQKCQAPEDAAVRITVNVYAFGQDTFEIGADDINYECTWVSITSERRG